ncbi:SRPBCC family protein [Mycolicibacterium litorale]|jgi:carbon monoxide dehydrogenase subunit G|uniref:type II toxin-antitoxin system Rv0910 family toxin n=1 Tax=Mycolicibacterium litorale TaxID=758802 RepID=UPI0034818C29
MGTITVSVELPAAPEKVWAILSSPAQFENWLTIHTKWKSDLPAELATGQQVTEVTTLMGMSNTITWNVDEATAPAKLRLSGSGMAGVKLALDGAIEPMGNGSKLTLGMEYAGQMIVGALGKAMENEGTRQLEASLEKFKALV